MFAPKSSEDYEDICPLMTYPLNPFKRRTLDDGLRLKTITSSEDINGHIFKYPLNPRADDGLRLKTITSFEYMGTPAEPLARQNINGAQSNGTGQSRTSSSV